MARKTLMIPDLPELPGYDDPGKHARMRLFLRLFVQNERRLYSYIFTLLPNRSDVDDLLQEVSLVMWDKFDSSQPPDDFVAWGCRIAYFKVLDFFKKRKRSRVAFSQPLLDRVAETALEHADSLRLDERREALDDCLKKLRERERTLLTRRFADDATIETAATSLGMSVDAAYKSLAKIRQALFDCVTNTLARESRR